MSGGIVRVFLDSLLEGLISARPIPVVIGFDHRQRGVGLGQRVVNRERFLRRIFRLRESFASWQQAVIAERDIGISQCSVGTGVLGIESEGLLQEFNALSYAFDVP